MWRILRLDADRIREGMRQKEMSLISENMKLEKALSESQARERAAVEELDVLHKRIGGELPKHCRDCELWGSAGWSQSEIGYCEGDDHPHKGTDSCNRWRRLQGREL